MGVRQVDDFTGITVFNQFLFVFKITIFTKIFLECLKLECLSDSPLASTLSKESENANNFSNKRNERKYWRGKYYRKI